MFRIEFDNGERKRIHNAVMGKGSSPVFKIRSRGFWAIMEDGKEVKIPISFMRVSEISALEEFLNAL